MKKSAVVFVQPVRDKQGSGKVDIFLQIVKSNDYEDESPF